MSKISKMSARMGATVMAVAAAGAVAAGSANAAPLPSGQHVVPTPDGWSVVLKSIDNSYLIQPSLATAQTRTTWVSSNGSVDVKAPKDAGTLDGKLGIGVVSGCQFPGQIGGGVTVTGPSATLGTGLSGSLGGISPSISIPLSPGTTSSVTGYGQSDQPSSLDSIKFTKPGTYNVSLKNQNIDIAYCSGYAQARLVTWVTIRGNNRIQGFLYGKPFSLG